MGLPKTNGAAPVQVGKGYDVTSATLAQHPRTGPITDSTDIEASPTNPVRFTRWGAITKKPRTDPPHQRLDDHRRSDQPVIEARATLPEQKRLRPKQVTFPACIILVRRRSICTTQQEPMEGISANEFFYTWDSDKARGYPSRGSPIRAYTSLQCVLRGPYDWRSEGWGTVYFENDYRPYYLPVQRTRAPYGRFCR